MCCFYPTLIFHLTFIIAGDCVQEEDFMEGGGEFYGVYCCSEAKRCVTVQDGIPVRKFQGGREAGKMRENGLRLTEKAKTRWKRMGVFLFF